MPSYTFVHEDTNEEVTHIFSISAMEEFVANNPSWKRVYSPLAIVSGTGSGPVTKTDKEWQSLLKNIKKKSGRGNTINV